MFGYVGLEDLEVRCEIGYDPHEKVKMQELLVDVQVEADLSSAIAGDHISDAVSYHRVAALMEERAARQKHHLLEALASDLLEALFENFPVSWAMVRVKKPHAHPLASSAYVELERFAGEEDEPEDEDDEE